MYVLKYIIASSIIVKIVFFLLFIMSIFLWAAFLDKFSKFDMISKYCDNFEKEFWSGIVLRDFYLKNKGNFFHPIGVIFESVMKIWISSNVKENINSIDNFSENLINTININIDLSMIKINSIIDKNNIFFLSIASIAPLIGLFGTICGIIDTFVSIGTVGNANLTTVAPGVSEALICTGFSILVAIFAAMIYNFFNAKILKLRSRLETFSLELINILMKDINTMYKNYHFENDNITSTAEIVSENDQKIADIEKVKEDVSSEDIEDEEI